MFQYFLNFILFCLGIAIGAILYYAYQSYLAYKLLPNEEALKAEEKKREDHKAFIRAKSICETAFYNDLSSLDNFWPDHKI